MLETFQNIGTAAKAAVNTFREVYSDPRFARGDNLNQTRRNVYDKYWQYYSSEAFENLNEWQSYFSDKGMYRYTRLLFNPMRRLVDFYAGRVFPGRLTLDGDKLPYGSTLAIPLADDVEPDLKAAIGQIWSWSNWQNGMRLMVRYAAVTGNCLVEIVDEIEKGKVRLDVIWAGNVKDIQLDAVGNVQMYELAYNTLDETGKVYLFGKKVTRDKIEYFKDGVEFDYYGDGAVQQNPYGFCAAAWVKHVDLGGDFGAGALRGSFIKMDEINSLATHCLDQIHKQIDPPFILWTSGIITDAFASASDAEKEDYDSRIDSIVLKGSPDGSKDVLVGNLVLSDALPYLDKLISEVERDHPEITFYQQLREMSQVTGPGARALLGDAESLFDEATSNYDSASIKLFQMSVAIGGFRQSQNVGGWQKKTTQQAKFAKFDLTSYERDELEIDITPRSLLAWSEQDDLDIATQRFDVANKADGLLPLDERIKVAGYSDEKERMDLIAKINEEQRSKSNYNQNPVDKEPVE